MQSPQQVETHQAKQKFARFDVSAYPYVTVFYTGGPCNGEDMQDYLDEFEALLIAARDLCKDDENQKIRFIFELRSINFLQVIRHMGSQADFVKMIAETGLVNSIAGTAIIISSDIARRVVQMVLDMVTLQKPHKTFDVRESAKEWLEKL
jgi:hypothetical protein